MDTTKGLCPNGLVVWFLLALVIVVNSSCTGGTGRPSTSPPPGLLQITTPSFPNSTVGSAYSTTAAAANGTSPYSWGIGAGALPAGLALNTTGSISGTPSATGQFSFTLRVSDSSSPPASASKSFIIDIASSGSFIITTTSLPNGTAGKAYSGTLSASGGTEPYQWSIANGSLPTGLGLNSGTGVITGTPGVAGQSNFTVQVQDSSSQQQPATASLSINVASAGPPPGAVVVTSFGATGNGTTDDTAAISSAIGSLQANQTLWFPCGTYVISSALSPIGLDGVTVEGPPGATNCVTLKATGSGSFTVLGIVGNGLSNSQNLAADTTANSFSVVSGGLAALGIVVGDYVLVSDTAVASNGSGSPPISTQQTVKVTAVSGDTATIEGTFAHNFTLVSPYPANQGCCPYVQKIGPPVSNASVKYLNFDGSALGSGSSSGAYALRMDFAVNSEVGFVNILNFDPSGYANAIRIDTGYQNNIHDITCTRCGNGGGQSLWVLRQSAAVFNNISITNTAAQQAFGFDAGSMNNSVVSNLIVDGGGADGRPFKLLRSNHNIVNGLTAKNGGNGKNGINITDISTYNTFNNCLAQSNNGSGIKMFGNFNTHNTFNNCTAKYNTGGQFDQGNDSFGNYGDAYTTVTGGTFCCARSASAIVWIYSNNFTITGSAVRDDQGQATSGLMLEGGILAVVKNNTFSSFPANTDIYIVSATSGTFSGNVTPDGTTPNPLP